MTDTPAEGQAILLKTRCNHCERITPVAPEVLALHRQQIANTASGTTEGVFAWQPIADAPLHEQVLVYWPLMALDEEGELTGEELDRYGHVSQSVRHGLDHAWEPDNVIEANGGYFGDDFEFGAPTHWSPLLPKPAAKKG